jgi:hypothetical protein
VNVYPFIEAEKAQQRTVKRECELLKVSRAAYYAARRNQSCTRAWQDAELAAEIAAVHADSKGRYGGYQSPADYEDNHPENIRQEARPLVTFPWAPHCSAGPAIRAVIGPSSP